MNNIKIIKITSLGCVSCIIMNKILNEISKEQNIEIENYDFDFDDIKKFNVGKILPEIIFYKDNKEIKRLCGEHKKEKIVNIIKEIK